MFLFVYVAMLFPCKGNLKLLLKNLNRVMGEILLDAIYF